MFCLSIFFAPLYNLPQFSALVVSIRHGRWIEVGQPGWLIRPTRRQSWKLRSPAGQVVMGRIFWVTFLFRHKKVTCASKRATKSYGYKICPYILPYGPAIKRLFNFDPIEISGTAMIRIKKPKTGFPPTREWRRRYRLKLNLTNILFFSAFFPPSAVNTWKLSQNHIILAISQLFA